MHRAMHRCAPGGPLRRARALCAGIVVLGTFASPAAAADWKPERAVEIVIPTTPGGGQDTIARNLERVLREHRLVEVSLVLSNRPGGNQAIGYAAVAQRAGDAHLLGIATVNLVTNRINAAHLLSHADVTPIALLAQEYLVFAVKADGALKSGRDMVERVRKDPQSVSFAFSPGPGAAAHLSAALVAKAAGVDPKKLKIVPFKSGRDATTAVLGGHVDVGVVSIPAAVGQIKAGAMRGLGIPSPQRLGGDLAEVPTWREQGFDAIYTNWRGVFGPKGLTEAQVRYWEAVLARVSQIPDWKKSLATIEQVPTYLDSRAFRKYLDDHDAQMRSLLSELGLAK